MVLILLASYKICGPILRCDHATTVRKHQWPHTNIHNISGHWYQGYKPEGALEWVSLLSTIHKTNTGLDACRI